MKKTGLIVLALLCWQGVAFGGDGDSSPLNWFEPYTPMYFSAGIPLSETPTAQNSDVKFRISLRKTFWGNETMQLYGTYTQTSLWSLFAPSSPFYDNWYNPGLHFSWEHPASGNILRTGFEHKSNGRDGDKSRSTNNLYAQYVHNWSQFSLQAKAWYGFGYMGDDIHNVMELFGFCSFSAFWCSKNDIITAALKLTPTDWFRRVDVGLEMYCRLGRNSFAPYLFLECIYGRDAMKDFIPDLHNERFMLRFGVAFKPERRFFF